MNSSEEINQRIELLPRIEDVFDIPEHIQYILTQCDNLQLLTSVKQKTHDLHSETLLFDYVNGIPEGVMTAELIERYIENNRQRQDLEFQIAQIDQLIAEVKKELTQDFQGRIGYFKVGEYILLSSMDGVDMMTKESFADYLTHAHPISIELLPKATDARS